MPRPSERWTFPCGNFAVSGQSTADFLVPLTLNVGGKFAERHEKLTIVDGKHAVVRLPPCTVVRVCFRKAAMINLSAISTYIPVRKP